jgi:hypothetical protein
MTTAPATTKIKATVIARTGLGAIVKFTFNSPEAAKKWAEFVTGGHMARAKAAGWSSQHDPSGYTGAIVIPTVDKRPFGEVYQYGTNPPELVTPEAQALAGA